MIKTRKIQLTGKSTFIVSLPKQWASRNGIGKGNEIYIEDLPDGSLKLGTEKGEKKNEEATINADAESAVELGRSIMSLYLNGVGTIIVHSKKQISAAQRKTVLSEVSRMMGFEVVEEKPDRMVLQDFFSHSNLSLQKTLRRSHMITCNMQSSFWNAISLGDRKALEGVLEMENEVDRLTFLIQRQLRNYRAVAMPVESLGIVPSEVSAYYVGCRRVERIADNLNKSAEEIIQIADSMPSEEVLPILSGANDFSFDLHSQAMKAFFEGDKSLANSLIDRNKEFQKQKIAHLRKLIGLKSVKPTSFILFTRYYEIANLGEDICEVVLNVPQ
ncbi:MAG: PhoU domain-containing protein [Candidatus Micrarchaeia archaeon]